MPLQSLVRAQLSDAMGVQPGVLQPQLEEPGCTRGPVEVDEAEIFEGSENRLTMDQMYTWEFQCNYQLQRYPFDTQVQGVKEN